MAKKRPIVLSMQKSFKILKYHLKLEFWALKKISISNVFVSEVGLIPVQPGLNPVQGGPIVVHPGLDSVLSRVSSTVQVGTWRIGKLSRDIMSILTPSPALSRTAATSQICTFFGQICTIFFSLNVVKSAPFLVKSAPFLVKSAPFSVKSAPFFRL